MTKKGIWIALLGVSLAAAGGVRADEVGRGGKVRWHASLEKARAAAREKGKLVFYYHVAGDLENEC